MNRPSPKIAVFRPSALGDFIFALPALTALKNRYRTGEIVYIGRKWHRDFLEKRPGPWDRIETIPDRAVTSETPEKVPQLAGFFRRMREERFDMAIQMYGGGRYSNPFVLQLGAKKTYGLKAEGAPTLSSWFPYFYYQNEIMRNLELASLAGAAFGDPQPHLETVPHDFAELEGTLGAAEKNEQWIVVHPGASDPRRRWAPGNFIKTIDRLRESAASHIFVTGMGAEKGIVEEVAGNIKAPVDNMYGKLTLGGLAALLKRADLLISNDTGPLHLANALGTKTVGLYWCANMINAAPPGRRLHRALSSWIISCPLCGADCASPALADQVGKAGCRHETSFLGGITVSDVLEQAQDLLDQGPSAFAPASLTTPLPAH